MLYNHAFKILKRSIIQDGETITHTQKLCFHSLFEFNEFNGQTNQDFVNQNFRLNC